MITNWEAARAAEVAAEVCGPRSLRRGSYRVRHEGDWRLRGGGRRRLVRPVSIQAAWLLEEHDEGGRWLAADWRGAMAVTVWEASSHPGRYWPTADAAVASPVWPVDWLEWVEG